MFGVQEPRIRTAPDWVFSQGEEAIDLAADAGLHLDPWEQAAVIDIMGETDEGLYAAFEAAAIVARQNGKGSIIETLELAWLFITGERLIIHTAHEFKTAAEGYERIKGLIENTPSLHKKVKQYHGSHGSEGITLKNGQRLRFMARTKAAGRGFTCDKLVYDEAYELSPRSVAASLPTLSARPNPQVIYTSSAPLDTSDALKAIRARGRREPGTDYESLLYLEWSADPKGYDLDAKGNRVPVSLDDRRGWAAANPGMGRRIKEDFTQKERAAMTDIDFGVERLGIVDEVAINAVLRPEKWETLMDVNSMVNDPVSFGIDTNPEGTWTSISVAGARADKKIHTELIERKRGLSWLVDRIVELYEDWEPEFIVMDAMSPAIVKIPEIMARGVEIRITSTKEYGAACGNYFELYEDDRLRHRGQAQLTTATETGTKRLLNEAGLWGWARADSGDISPLVSSTLAVWGYFQTLAEEEEEGDHSVVVFRR